MTWPGLDDRPNALCIAALTRVILVTCKIMTLRLSCPSILKSGRQKLVLARLE